LKKISVLHKQRKKKPGPAYGAIEEKAQFLKLFHISDIYQNSQMYGNLKKLIAKQKNQKFPHQGIGKMEKLKTLFSVFL